MAVTKYRSAHDMPRPARVEGDELADRIRAVLSRAFLLSPPSFSRGVQRFRNVREANEARERATLERMRASRNR